MRLVDDQERAVLAGRRAQHVVEAGLRRDDADVRERRLCEHTCDVAVGELALERLGVVPLDDAGRPVEWDGRPEVAFAGDDAPALVERCEALVDGAVVAPVEDEHFRPAGDVTGEADREPVRVGGRERELPARQPEAPRQLVADSDCVLAREHERDPAARLFLDRADGRPGRVPGHRPRVAEAEVDVLEPVGVAKACTLRFDGEDGEATRPAHHPVHRHAAEQRRLRLLRERVRARMLTFEARELVVEQLLDAHRCESITTAT